MNKTKIEYLDYTWNPIVMRCTPVSGGCRNCWHIAMCKRLAKNPLIGDDEQAAYESEPPILDSLRLEEPPHIKKPARIGVQFMGDILHDSIDGFWISAIWGIMQKCPQHTFFILTKRIQRFLKLTPPLPVLDNLWLGVSVEDQKTYDERASILSMIECAHRFISFEPILGPITVEFLDWRCDLAIVGGETGPRARPIHPDWVRSIKDQCHTAGVPFFFKSWGDNPKIYGDLSVKRKGRSLDGREWNEIPNDFFT